MRREELLEALRRAREALSEALAALDEVIADIEYTPPPPGPGERVREVRAGRRRIASIVESDGSVRLLARREPGIYAMPEALEYVRRVVEEIRAWQAERGEARATLREVLDPDGRIVEVAITGLSNELERVKARAALAHLAESSWMYTRARASRGPRE